MLTRLSLLPLVVLFTCFTSNILCQNDTLFFANDEWIRGDLKNMEKNVAKFSTKYDDSDFKIEWNKVIKIKTVNQFYITTISGEHFYGTLKMESDSLVQIIENDTIVLVSIPLSSIIHILEFNDRFTDRFSFEIDFGFGYANSKNLTQLSTNNLIGYNAKKWRAEFTISSLFNNQKETEPIKRSESYFSYEYILYKEWYIVTSAQYFSNTEQNINNRWSGNLALGNYLFRNNKAYLSLKSGINRNLESFSDTLSDNKSWEGIVGIAIELFNTGDLDMFLQCLVYPGISAKDRLRIDTNFRIKYDLPYDLYIRQDFTLNFDNQAINQSKTVDFITTFGVGWEW